MEPRTKRFLIEAVLGRTIVIEYTSRSGNLYTWYINDNWIIVISFTITLCICFLKKLRKQRLSNKTKNKTTPRGGSFVEECIEPDTVYEIVDEDLKCIIGDLVKDSYFKEFMKKTFRSKKPLIVTPMVLFVAVANQYNVGTQISLFGFKFMLDNLIYSFRLVVGKMVVGVVFGISAFLFLLANMTAPAFFAFLASGLVLFGVSVFRNITCDKYLRKLPELSAVERVLSNSDTKKYLLARPKKELDKTILLQDFANSQASELYIDKLKHEICSTQMHQSNQRLIRDCENQKIYLRVDQIRITDKDIKRKDASDIRKEAQKLNKTYQSRVNQNQKTLAASDGSQPAVENSGRPSQTVSTPAWESPLFKRIESQIPIKKPKSHLPLKYRTKTWSQLLQETKVTVAETLEQVTNSYPYESQATVEDLVKPSKNLQQRVEKSIEPVSEKLNPDPDQNSEEL